MRKKLGVLGLCLVSFLLGLVVQPVLWRLPQKPVRIYTEVRPIADPTDISAVHFPGRQDIVANNREIAVCTSDKDRPGRVEYCQLYGKHTVADVVNALREAK